MDHTNRNREFIKHHFEVVNSGTPEIFPFPISIPERDLTDLRPVARGNEPVATALANCPTIALPETAAWCKFPAHVIQETRRLAFAADERKHHQSPLVTIKHSIPFRGAA
jgi:hypothetical protein